MRAKQWPKQPSLQIVKNTGCHLLPKGDFYRHGSNQETIPDTKKAVEVSSREALKDSQQEKERRLPVQAHPRCEPSSPRGSQGLQLSSGTGCWDHPCWELPPGQALGELPLGTPSGPKHSNFFFPGKQAEGRHLCISPLVRFKTKIPNFHTHRPWQLWYT